MPPLCRRELEDERNDVRKVGHLGNFYKNLLTNNVAFGTKQAPEPEPQEEAAGPGPGSEAAEREGSPEPKGAAVAWWHDGAHSRGCAGAGGMGAVPSGALHGMAFRTRAGLAPRMHEWPGLLACASV